MVDASQVTDAHSETDPGDCGRGGDVRGEGNRGDKVEGHSKMVPVAPFTTKLGVDLDE